MSTPREHKPVKLVASLFSADVDLLSTTIRELIKLYGITDFISEIIQFDFTDYYQQEFGSPLFRRFIAFKELIPPESLVAVKLKTNEIEALPTQVHSRRVNIDPGFVSAHNFILATCKGFAHRSYLGNGVYAELTFIFREGHYHPLEWTYPDYSANKTISMFERIREAYLSSIETREAQDA